MADHAEKVAVLFVGDRMVGLVKAEAHDDDVPAKDDEHVVVVVATGSERARRGARPLPLAVGVTTVAPPVEPVDARPVDPAFLT